MITGRVVQDDRVAADCWHGWNGMHRTEIKQENHENRKRDSRMSMSESLDRLLIDGALVHRLESTILFV